MHSGRLATVFSARNYTDAQGIGEPQLRLVTS